MLVYRHTNNAEKCVRLMEIFRVGKPRSARRKDRRFNLYHKGEAKLK